MTLHLNACQNVPKSERRRYLDEPDVAHLAAAADVGCNAPLDAGGAEVAGERPCAVIRPAIVIVVSTAAMPLLLVPGMSSRRPPRS